MQKPKLIIFDCDGVLVDSEVISAKILVQELAKINITVSEQHTGTSSAGL
jgi:beta-phosphoglucomutase-like phosphatase (HAD superfamily)